jgi:predicted GTPase
MITPEIGTARLKKELDLLLETNIPVFIHGAPGIGKSYIVNEIAAKDAETNPAFATPRSWTMLSKIAGKCETLEGQRHSSTVRSDMRRG